MTEIRFEVDGKVIPIEKGNYILLVHPSCINFDVLMRIIQDIHKNFGADIIVIPCYDITKVKLLKIEKDEI
jgi:hypothetical protein